MFSVLASLEYLANSVPRSNVMERRRGGGRARRRRSMPVVTSVECLLGLGHRIVKRLPLDERGEVCFAVNGAESDQISFPVTEAVPLGDLGWTSGDGWCSPRGCERRAVSAHSAIVISSWPSGAASAVAGAFRPRCRRTGRSSRGRRSRTGCGDDGDSRRSALETKPPQGGPRHRQPRASSARS